MKMNFASLLCNTICLVFVFSFRTVAQTDSSVSVLQQVEKGLFDTDDVLYITLKGNIRQLLNDRSGVPKKHPLVLSYTKKDSSEMTIPVEVKTRGHFRKLEENCFYPPLLIRFSKEGSQLLSVFREQHKLKLVMPCTEDEYIIREWLVYKLYNLVTPKSFRARLAKVKLEDDKTKKLYNTFFGIFLEEEKQMAKRNQGIAVERKLTSQQTVTDAFLTMAVFEYLIGNTDWSVPYLHNIILLAPDSNTVPSTVPYDFDHAGIVNAPYAGPPEELQLTSVRERRYRGYCVQDMKEFDAVIERYNSLKNDIYRIYTDCTMLDPKYIKSTIKFLDKFYATINNPKTRQKEFAYPCNNKGNVVIKGMERN
jgi:hypothetical protein